MVAGVRVESEDEERERILFSPARGAVSVVRAAPGVAAGLVVALCAASGAGTGAFREGRPLVAGFALSFGVLCLTPALSFRATRRSWGGEAGAGAVGWVGWDMVCVFGVAVFARWDG